MVKWQRVLTPGSRCDDKAAEHISDYWRWQRMLTPGSRCDDHLVIDTGPR